MENQTEVELELHNVLWGDEDFINMEYDAGVLFVEPENHALPHSICKALSFLSICNNC